MAATEILFGSEALTSSDLTSETLISSDLTSEALTAGTFTLETFAPSLALLDREGEKLRDRDGNVITARE